MLGRLGTFALFTYAIASARARAHTQACNDICHEVTVSVKLAVPCDEVVSMETAHDS